MPPGQRAGQFVARIGFVGIAALAPSEIRFARRLRGRFGVAREEERGKRDQGRTGRGGYGMASAMMRVARKELELTDDQKKKLDTIGEELRSGRKDANPRSQLNAALAKVVKDGKVDAASLSTELDAVEKHAEARVAAQAKALGDLHAALTPEQRKKVADSIKAKHDERAERWKSKADAKDGAERPGKRGRPGGKRGAFGMLRGIELTDEQKKKVEALGDAKKDAKPDFAKLMDERRKRSEALLAAFVKDDFDATEYPLEPDAGKHARSAAEKRIAHLASLLGISNADQRTKLSERLERGPTRRGFRGRGKGRGKRGPAADDAELDEILDDLDVELDDEPEAEAP